MNITFINVAKNKRSRYKTAMEFYANILMEPEIHEPLTIELHTSKQFKSYGQVLNDDFLTDKPQFFKIELKIGDELDHPLLTLAHEMVHIKQFAMGQLTYDFITENIQLLKLKGLKVKPLWMGKTIQFRDCESSYWDSPWEIESFGRQDSLYDRFLDWEKLNDILY